MFENIDLRAAEERRKAAHRMPDISLADARTVNPSTSENEDSSSHSESPLSQGTPVKERLLIESQFGDIATGFIDVTREATLVVDLTIASPVARAEILGRMQDLGLPFSPKPADGKDPRISNDLI